MKWIILMMGIACNASASVLIKMAVTPPRRFPTLSDPFAVFQNWPLIIGVACYLGAFLLYALALTKLPLNITHPVMTSGAVASVAVLSVVLFQEPFDWKMVLGIILVITGMFFITAKVA
jgi:multidrug transporter EmrE-like cation transporter